MTVIRVFVSSVKDNVSIYVFVTLVQSTNYTLVVCGPEGRAKEVPEDERTRGSTIVSRD
jgi:hypothetical protein